jgi:hypothetical protein
MPSFAPSQCYAFTPSNCLHMRSLATRPFVPAVLALYPGSTAVWNPNRNRWTRLANAPYGGEPSNFAAVWAGSRLLLWGEMSPGVGGNGNESAREVGLSYGN